MRVIITAVGPSNWGLADPIVHYVTSVGAHIAEIQMYDHNNGGLFAMLLRLYWPGTRNTLTDLRAKMAEIGREHALSIRTWSPEEQDRPPRLAICVTYRPEPALAVVEAIRAGELRAEPVVLIGNRPACQSIAARFDVDWHMIGDADGNPDNERMVEVFDRHEVDYIVLARYMRLIPPCTCWKFAGGRIINLHHGLLPAFPGAEPYRDAYSQRMLTFGATAHFIVPELDAGGQIIHQETFTVAPGTPLEEVVRIGQQQHEARCLVEGLRRVLDRKVELRFDKVVPVARRPEGKLLNGTGIIAGKESEVRESITNSAGRSCNLLLNTPSAKKPRDPTPSPTPSENGICLPPVRTGKVQAVTSPVSSHRVDRAALGFWLGAVCLGTGGCLGGALIPYRHPVGVAMSALWWAIYFGCFGASIGALLSLFLRGGSRVPQPGVVRRRGRSPVRAEVARPGGDPVRDGQPAIGRPAHQTGVVQAAEGAQAGDAKPSLINAGGPTAVAPCTATVCREVEP
jgi:formyltetrahydrofolate deformylase